MAGLEIAGLILGALPLAIKAVQGYRETFHSIKNVQRDLCYIERDLQTERLNLQNTCEALLVGIVPPTKIHSMIENPFGPEWKSYADQLLVLPFGSFYIARPLRTGVLLFTSHRRLRLYTSYGKFEEHIKDMSKATEELRLKLGIEEGSQINTRDKASILEAFKRNPSFTFKKKEYEGILLTIKASNAALQVFSSVNRELEPDRRRRSQSRVTKLLRNLSQSIYSALCNALCCACINSHAVGFQLTNRDAVMLPSDVDDQVAREFYFHIAFGTFEAANEGETIRTPQHGNEEQQTPYWKNFELRLMPKEKAHPTPNTPPPEPTTSSHTTRVGWSLSMIFKVFKHLERMFSAARSPAQTPMSLQATTKSTDVPPPMVPDLCDFARGRPKAAAVSCYGYIVDKHDKFLMSPASHEVGPRKHATLRQVIAGQIPGLPLFGLEEKMQVALALSASILHLDGTLWLEQVVTLDNIVFMVGGQNSKSQPARLFYKPFKIQPVPSNPTLQAAAHSAIPFSLAPAQAPCVPSQEQPINLAILSLGALLIQVIIGRVENGLEMADALDIGSVVSKWGRGNQLKEEVLMSGGMNYAKVVKWCLGSVYRVGGLQHDEFCQDFHEEVVRRLQDDLKIITSNG